jgi:thiosulfate dehydrogenase [quinone] large subunit
MASTATVTRSATYRLTALAAVLFLLLCWLFGDGLLSGALWNAERWIDSPLITYLLLALIVLAGVLQANRLPPGGLTLRFSRDEATPGQTAEPVFAKLLFGNVYWALVWLPLRLFVRREWLGSGTSKVGNPAWVDSGEALKGFWESAVAVNEGGQGRITYDWYRAFLQYMLDHQWYTWFAKLVVAGEVLVGLGLLLGGLAGIAAFAGACLNFNFGLAGAASSNPIMLALGLLLALAWRTAGFWGLDRWLLPLLGTPWQPGAAFAVAPYPAGEVVDPTLAGSGLPAPLRPAENQPVPTAPARAERSEVAP